MITAADVLRVAEDYTGCVESGGSDGRSGNITSFWARYDKGLQGQPWCGVFVSAVFTEAGAPLPRMDRPYGFMNCASAVAYAKRHDLFDDDGAYQPGDIILFGPGGIKHTGIVVKDHGPWVETIEGNTSQEGVAGSQTNGGGVYRRRRPHGSFIYGVLRTRALLAAASGPPRSAPDRARPGAVRPGAVRPGAVRPTTGRPLLRVDGELGPATIRAWQRVMGTQVDGVIDRRRSDLVVEVQRRLGLTGDAVDGELGPDTICALQRRMGTMVDGVIDRRQSDVVTALQRRLRAGRF